MSYHLSIKDKAVKLRKYGYSIKEIAAKLNIAKSTSSIWLKNISLSPNGYARLKKRKSIGQYKARLIQIERRGIETNEQVIKATQLLSKIEMSKEICKLCCALIYWCEGNKENSFVRFTNSDPTVIRLFLSLLKEGFNIDKSKFRILMHLHNYHNEKRQKEFWNAITKIPLGQFHKTYWKPNTGKRNHQNYQGCVAISYYDARVAKELMAIYNSLVQRGVG